MDIQEIVKKFLIDNGFDGLWNEGCSCEIADLMPCGEPGNCEAGHKIPCPGGEECEIGGAEFGCRFHIAKG